MIQLDDLTDDKIERLVGSIEEWPLVLLDTKSGARIEFENGDQLKSWLNPFSKSNDIFGGIGGIL